MREKQFPAISSSYAAWFTPRRSRVRRITGARPRHGKTTDPLQFERLRQTVTSLRGDASLTALSDRQLAQALQLVETKDGALRCYVEVSDPPPSPRNEPD